MANFVDGLIFVPARVPCVVHVLLVVVAHIFPPLVGYAQETPFPRCARTEGVEGLRRIIDEARDLVDWADVHFSKSYKKYPLSGRNREFSGNIPCLGAGAPPDP